MTRREIEKKLKGKLNDRELKIILDYALGTRKSAIARDVNLSRERIRQIIKVISGSNDPDIQAKATSEEFIQFIDLARDIGLSTDEIAMGIGIAPSSLNLYYSNPDYYIKDKTKAVYIDRIRRVIVNKLRDIEQKLDNIL